MQTTDPRKPLIIGIIVMGILVFAGIVWAVAFAPTERSVGTPEANLAFDDSNNPVYGPDNAKIVVRMFEDFQCPACRAAKAGVDYAKKKFGDRVKFVWVDFPLQSVHLNARIAANAARCAEEQGLFWEYHDLLFDFQPNWAEQKNPMVEFTDFARKTGLHEGAFTACLNARTYDEKIVKDMEEGRANNVQATPTFFINKTRVSGALSAADWDKYLLPLLNTASTSQEVGESSTQ